MVGVQKGGSHCREQSGTTESSEACTSLNPSISGPGNCDQSPQWGCMRVSSQCRLWRRESEPARRPTDSPSEIMSDPQVGRLNSWVSTCVWMIAEVNMLDPCSVRSLDLHPMCLTRVSTSTLCTHVNLVLPWHSFSPGIMGNSINIC